MTKRTLTTEDLIRAADLSRDDLKNLVRRGLLAFSGRPGKAREFTRDDLLLAAMTGYIRRNVLREKIPRIASELVDASKRGVIFAAVFWEYWIEIEPDEKMYLAFDKIGEKIKAYPIGIHVLDIGSITKTVDDLIANKGVIEWGPRD
jgi:hypothetical protein